MSVNRASTVDSGGATGKLELLFLGTVGLTVGPRRLREAVAMEAIAIEHALVPVGGFGPDPLFSGR